MSEDQAVMTEQAWWGPGLRRIEDCLLLMHQTDLPIHVCVGGLWERLDEDGQPVGGLWNDLPVDPQGKPQGYLVHLPPDRTVSPHFHRMDQFQVLFGGEGVFYLRTPVAAGAVLLSYTDAFSTYGPFGGGSEGLDFFSFRSAGDTFTGRMPGSRHLVAQHGGRNLKCVIDLETKPKLGVGASEIETLLAPSSDGLAAYLLRGGPESKIQAPAVDGRGQYYCVIRGDVSCAGERYGPKSAGWVYPDSTSLTLSSSMGSDFAVLVMQHPNPPSYVIEQ